MQLYEYQQKFVDWYQEHPKVLLADEPGLGKTAQAAIATAECQRVMIVASSGLLYWWRDEVIRWTDATLDDFQLVWSARQLENPRTRYFLVDWSSVAALNAALAAIKWDAIVIDEAHKMKQRNSQRGLALRGGGSDKNTKKIMKKFLPVKAPLELELTGTPIVNFPADLWALLNYLDSRKWPGYWKFFQRYVYAIPNVFGGYEIIGSSNEEELRQQIQNHVVRRTVKQISPDAKVPVRTVYQVPMGPEQRKAYDELEDVMETEIYSSRMIDVLFNDATADFELEDGDVRQLLTPTVLAKLTRLRQIAISTGLLSDDVSAPSPKLNAVMDILEERNYKPTVIGTQFKWPIAALRKRLEKAEIPYVTLTGADSPADRAANVKKFQEGNTPVMLMTVQAGGEGWTMSAADCMVFVDKPWSPAILKQAEDRLRTHLQEERCQLISLQALDSVESRVEELLARKAEMFSAVFDKWQNAYEIGLKDESGVDL